MEWSPWLKRQALKSRDSTLALLPKAVYALSYLKDLANPPGAATTLYPERPSRRHARILEIRRGF
jgi:hypothetical protein